MSSTIDKTAFALAGPRDDVTTATEGIYIQPAAFALTEVVTGFLVKFAVIQAVEAGVTGAIWRFLSAGLALGYAGLTHPLLMTAFVSIVLALLIVRWLFQWSHL